MKIGRLFPSGPPGNFWNARGSSEHQGKVQHFKLNHISSLYLKFPLTVSDWLPGEVITSM